MLHKTLFAEPYTGGRFSIFLVRLIDNPSSSKPLLEFWGLVIKIYIYFISLQYIKKERMKKHKNVSIFVLIRACMPDLMRGLILYNVYSTSLRGVININ